MRTVLKKVHMPARSLLMAFGLTALVLGVSLTDCATPAQSQDQGVKSLRQIGQAFESVAKSVSPGVVFIRVDKVVKNQPAGFFGPGQGSPFGDDFFNRFFGSPFGGQGQGSQHVAGQGSGFIISKKGYIITNNHVVGDADKVSVTLQDGRTFTASIVGTDPQSDVAVVKIDAGNLTALPLGDSDSLVVGEWVVAVGNPFGLTNTITAGIVSATGRSNVGLADYEDFIQTDAAINPGNSGGPLVDLDGDVVGVNSAIVSRSGGNVGVGFAIPISMVKAISDQLIEHGSVTRGYLGIVIQDLTPDLAESFGLENATGLVVSQVMQGSPADKGGLKQGDLVLEMDGKPVKHSGDFRNEVALMAPGTHIDLTVYRDGKKQSVDITVGEQPESGQTAQTPGHAMSDLGFSVQNLTPDLARELGIDDENGVVVTHVDPGSAADLAGIRPGVLIQEVDKKPVSDTKEFKSALASKKAGAPLLLLVKDGKYSRFVVLKTD
jgi:serine protease Do